MSGVWVFKNGVIRLVENPQAESSSQGSRKKALVHLPTGQVVSSYSSLEQILTDLGWERYYGGDPDLFQFHKRSSIDLISLPRDFSKFNSVYMYDIVIKNPNIFHVRDMWSSHLISDLISWWSWWYLLSLSKYIYIYVVSVSTSLSLRIFIVVRLV